MWKCGLTKYLVFCGGVGHSTKNLKRKVARILRKPAETLPGTEAELYASLAAEKYGIPEEAVILEKRSTNTAENIRYAMNLLEERQIAYRTVLLIQDPILQRRSYITARELMPEETKLISWAPFLPSVDREGKIQPKIPFLWEEGRFYELLLGEIWRLRDDENGYGPRGRGFLPHVEIPPEVDRAHRNLSDFMPQYDTRR